VDETKPRSRVLRHLRALVAGSTLWTPLLDPAEPLKQQDPTVEDWQRMPCCDPVGPVHEQPKRKPTRFLFTPEVIKQAERDFTRYTRANWNTEGLLFIGVNWLPSFPYKVMGKPKVPGCKIDKQIVNDTAANVICRLKDERKTVTLSFPVEAGVGLDVPARARVNIRVTVDRDIETPKPLPFVVTFQKAAR
jgi:hypothetical protein